MKPRRALDQGRWPQSATPVAGVALFVLLFYVYASSLQYAELSLVTLGCVVLLQVGVIMLDRFRYGQVLTADTWLAVGLILVGQAYPLLSSSGARGAPSA